MCNHDKYKNFKSMEIYCRECKEHDALYDHVHDEVFCRHCGKVLRMNYFWLNF
ncbi:MAG: hypothetical protein IJH63_02115 [Methanobrevibacter sp.]|nr:hypothetical protein [Methanobrevibacter sp.]